MVAPGHWIQSHNTSGSREIRSKYIITVASSNQLWPYLCATMCTHLISSGSTVAIISSTTSQFAIRSLSIHPQYTAARSVPSAVWFRTVNTAHVRPRFLRRLVLHVMMLPTTPWRQARDMCLLRGVTFVFNIWPRSSRNAFALRRWAVAAVRRPRRPLGQCCVCAQTR